MIKQDLIDMCLGLDGAVADYPFDESWAVLRHGDTRKWFACVFERDGVCINLKIEPAMGALLQEEYKSITPAYHMNKWHWIMVKTGGDVDKDMLLDLIRVSYTLTAKKKKIKRKL